MVLVPTGSPAPLISAALNSIIMKPVLNAEFLLVKDYFSTDWVGFNTRKKWLDNLNLIKQDGIEQWFAEQLEKQTLLEEALRYFHNNRMRSFFCLSFLYFQIDTIKKLVTAAQASKNEDLQKRAASFEEAVKTEAIQHNLKIWDQ